MGGGYCDGLGHRSGYGTMEAAGVVADDTRRGGRLGIGWTEDPRTGRQVYGTLYVSALGVGKMLY